MERAALSDPLTTGFSWVERVPKSSIRPESFISGQFVCPLWKKVSDGWDTISRNVVFLHMNIEEAFKFFN